DIHHRMCYSSVSSVLVLKVIIHVVRGHSSVHHLGLLRILHVRVDVPMHILEKPLHIGVLIGLILLSWLWGDF
ncbi:hypothetical protein PMAYCL1PPCAC_05562, partial [Pristionchus mayeri]